MKQAAKYLYDIIADNPGLKMAGIAKMAGWPRSTVLRRLPYLESFCLLTWEDENGRLYPFRPWTIDWDAMY